MKLPFLILPRTVYDDQRRDLEAAWKRVDELQQIVFDLKLEGAQIVRTHPELFKRRLEKKDVDLIDVALDENPKCRRNHALRRRMREWADLELQAGRTTAYVLERIGNWDRIDAAAAEAEDEEDRRMGLIQ